VVGAASQTAATAEGTDVAIASVRAAAAMPDAPRPHRPESPMGGQLKLGAALAAWAAAAAAETGETTRAVETATMRVPTEQLNLGCSRRAMPNMADFRDKFAEDDYDPRNKKYILPATAQEVLELDICLLQKQILRLSGSIPAREFTMKEDPTILQGYKDMLESTRRQIAGQRSLLGSDH